MIWKTAMDTCFVPYKAVLKIDHQPDAMARASRRGIKIPTSRQVKVRRLCKSRWLRLQLSCKTSYEVAKGADAERLKKIGMLKYWWQGDKWEALVRYSPKWGSMDYEKLDVNAEERDLGDCTCYPLSWAYGSSVLVF